MCPPYLISLGLGIEKKQRKIPLNGKKTLSLGHNMKMQLSRNIFWDTSYESIQWDQNSSYVIDRVLHYGTLKDWKQVLLYYGKDQVREIVKKLRYLDRRVLSYCAVFFNLPKEEFRCYNIEPSLKEHWDY